MFPVEVMISSWSSDENLTLKENFQNSGNQDLCYCYFSIYGFYPYFPPFVYMCCWSGVFSKTKKPLESLSDRKSLHCPFPPFVLQIWHKTVSIWETGKCEKIQPSNIKFL